MARHATKLLFICSCLACCCCPCRPTFSNFTGKTTTMPSNLHSKNHWIFRMQFKKHSFLRSTFACLCHFAVTGKKMSHIRANSR
ncbi:hypothetical protein GQ55_7G137600 [Panicum hallii var. hallii]|uniref:Secreted protein n=1 Tax=Panicum hallii var. hallii TaxID=1504633 RepID=A0A2T7CUU7_9POAL|nr:hypothetical protein GQ55_7G137600 [Panicum hallii var. hallii]